MGRVMADWNERETIDPDLGVTFVDDYPTNIGDTCCGRCPGASCYVDYLTGERE